MGSILTTARLPALLVLVASAQHGVCAQQQHFTAPPGFEQTEGPLAVQFLNPFYNAAARFQYVDGGQRGTPRLAILALALRRDGPQTSTSPARVVDVEVVMAETDAGSQSTTFAANYNGTAVTVFQRKNLSLPDHSVAPPSPPAPFDVVFVFDTPFAYSGNRDLLWEVRLFANQAAGLAYSLDSVDTTIPGEGQYSYLGFQSCTTAVGPYWFHALTPRTDPLGIAQVSCWAEHAPRSAPTVLAIGLADSGFSAYLCAPLRTSADVLIALLSDATGLVGSAQTPLSFPVPISARVQLYLQFASLDPAQAPNLQVALSDAALYSLVPYGIGPRVSRLFALGSATASVGTAVANGVPIARFTY